MSGGDAPIVEATFVDQRKAVSTRIDSKSSAGGYKILW